MNEAENTFNKYKDFLQSKWQRKILLICWIVVFIILGMEFFNFATLLKLSQRVDEIFRYVMIRIVMPSALNFSVLIIAACVRRSGRFSTMTKNMWVSFSIFMICSVLAIFHNYFQILLVSPAVAFFICAVFGEAKILQRLLVLTVPTLIISAVTFLIDPNTEEGLYKVLSMICDFVFIICAYVFARALMKSQVSQLDYIHDFYGKQIELVEELKIEPLTKLYNRTALDGAISRILKRIKTENINPFLVMLDIDFFKKVNDEYGHVAGDKVLVALAEIIRKNMGSNRRAFRYGGEEFVLIFENSMPSIVIYTVQSIRADFAAARFDFSGDASFTLSAGISGMPADFNGTTWIDNADKCLYYAKNNGRNQVKTADIVYEV